MQTLYQVTVQPRARRDAVIPLGERAYKVTTTKPALEGSANTAVIKLLAAHLGVKKSQLFIKSGEKSRHKVIMVTA